MPDHLKALVVILTLASVMFVAAKAPACAMAMTAKDFERRRNLWFALVVVAFLAHSFWIYMIVAATLLYTAQRSEPNRFALYLFLLLALPGIQGEVPAIVINYLFVIDWPRLLSLTLLFPAYLALRKQPGVEPFGRLMPDRLVGGYLILGFLLTFEYSNLTTAFRKGIFYAFIDVFLPYYVASRALRSVQQFREALMSFAIAALVLSPILCFEFAKQWLLYSSLEEALGQRWAWNGYTMRAGDLRASGTVGHPIAAGYVIAVAAACYLYLRVAVPSRTAWLLGLLALAGGLLAPISRGPWVGLAAMVVVLVLTGPAPTRDFVRLGLLGLAGLPVLLMTKAGERIIDYLPFIGTIEAHNVEGRQRLAVAAYQVFLENPILGTSNFLERPEMEALRDPTGLIDLVNTYVIIGLNSGLVGLTLFVGLFAAVLLRLYKAMRSQSVRTDEQYALGQTLFAILLGILLMIGTVAPVLLIVPIYWSFAGLGLGYAQMLAQSRTTQPSGRAQRAAPAAVPVRARVTYPR